MPPRTALVPSSLAARESQSFSEPVASVHEVTVAPYRRTETDSPVGRTAVTDALSSEMVTVGCGVRPGVDVRAVGLFARPTMVVG